MVIYEPVIGNNMLNNILDYPELIKFINQGGVDVKQKQTDSYGQKVNLASEKSRSQK